MAELYDITGWTIQEWHKPTMGTRAKNYVEDPATGEVYFFKESAAKFPEEFWSEIISSKFGQLIGLNVLDYNIAISGNTPGCISKHMLGQGHKQLYHAVDLFKDFLPGFVVTNKPKFCFQEILEILDLPIFNKFINNIIEIIIFDALIGNGDRHLENWALIIDYDIAVNEYIGIKTTSFINKISTIVKRYLGLNLGIREDKNLLKNISAIYSFAPIYDSGSCLGREKKEIEINNFLNDEQQIIKYLKNGMHEIRWQENKVNFFDLVTLVQKDFPKEVNTIAKLIFEKAQEQKILELVETIDEKLNNNYSNFKLTLQRKKLISNLLIKRVSHLKERLNLD